MHQSLAAAGNGKKYGVTGCGYQGMKTHLTMQPGSYRKVSIHNVLQEVSQNISFFIIKVCHKIKQISEHRLYPIYASFMNIVYCKHEISGELDCPSCLLQL